MTRIGSGALQKDVWHRECATISRRNSIQLRRWGMRVTVYNDPTPSNNGDYVLTYNEADTNKSNNANWLKVADIGATWGGGGSSYTFGSGLTETGGVVSAGGVVSSNITFSPAVNDTYQFNIGGGNRIGAFNVNSYNGFFNFASQVNFQTATTLLIQATELTLTNPLGVRSLTFNAEDGIEFSGAPVSNDADWILDYTDRTLADWGNVKSHIGGQEVDSLIQNPTVSEDGYVIAWNNTDMQYELVPQSGGSSVTFGSAAQVPYMNSGATDFAYESGFEYNATDNRFTAQNIRLGSSSTPGDRVIDFDSSDTTAYLTIGGAADPNSGRIRLSKSSGSVYLAESFHVWSDTGYTDIISVIGKFGDSANIGGTEKRVTTQEAFTYYGNSYNGNGGLLKLRAGDTTATSGNSIRTGHILISAGRPYNPSDSGDVSIGTILFNSYEPLNDGTYGNASFWNSNIQSAPNFQGGEKIIYFGNAVTVPSAAPTDGVFFYVNSGELEVLNATGPAQSLSGRANVVTAPSGNLTLTQAHRGAVVFVSGASPVVTLSNLGANFQCTIVFIGTGTLTFNGYTNFNSPGGVDEINVPNGQCYLLHTGSNTWFANGTLV